MQPITYKEVLDENGDFTALELWQDEYHITISLAQSNTHTSGYRWDEVKEIVDNIVERNRKATSQELGKMMPQPTGD